MSETSQPRQPVHTVYGGAHLFSADIAQKLGAAALKALDEYAPTPPALAQALGLDPALAHRIHPRIVDKLTREPVEDFRIDFEDGFGTRPDAEEDHFARLAAEAVADGLGAGLLPPGIGIRIKTLSAELTVRSLRTLDLFLTRLVERTRGSLPTNFAITLPKITAPAEVATLAGDVRRVRARPWIGAGIAAHRADGRDHAVDLRGRWNDRTPPARRRGPRPCRRRSFRDLRLHGGAVDYRRASAHGASRLRFRQTRDAGRARRNAGASLRRRHQHHAGRSLSRVGEPALSDAQRRENTEVVHRAWRLHAEHIRHSLIGGFYQGWDLHPAQLPTRYAAVYAFFLEGLAPASERLRNFVAKAAQATLVGDVFDDAATGQGLLNFFLRAVNCGAVAEEEAMALSGLTLDELRGRSFARILANRRAGSTA